MRTKPVPTRYVQVSIRTILAIVNQAESNQFDNPLLFDILGSMLGRKLDIEEIESCVNTFSDPAAARTKLYRFKELYTWPQEG